MAVKKTSSAKETQRVEKDSLPEVTAESMLKRLDELEVGIAQLEIVLKDVVTFDNLAARLTDKKPKRTRAKREWTQDEKDAFHKRMVEARMAKDEAPQEAD